MNDVELAIRLTADADQAARAVEGVGDSFGRMASDVDDATRKADAATSRMDSVADSADNMASTSSQAAGGLGDLGGALSLMPGPLGAVGTGMESLAPAIMGVTGASDLVNLAMGSTVVQATKARLAAARYAVTSKATAAATRAWAVAQRILNSAFLGNPILLALVAVAAIFLVLYKRSERFRQLVRNVMDAGRTAIGWVWDRLQDVGDAFGTVQDKAGDAVRWVVDRVVGLRTKVGNVAESVEDKLVGAFEAAKKPVEWLWDKVQDIVDWIGKIDIPDLPFGNPFNGRRAPGGAPTAGAAGDTYQTTINLYGIAATGDDVVRQLQALFQRYGLQVGLVAP